MKKSGVRVVQKEGSASAKALRQKRPGDHCARAIAMRIHGFTFVPLWLIPMVLGKLLNSGTGKNILQSWGAMQEHRILFG